MAQSKKKNALCLMHAFASGKFLISIAVLIAAAVGLHPTVKMLSDKYEKKTIAIRKPLASFDIKRLPSFRTGWKVQYLKAQPEDIDTNEYTHVAVIRDSPLVLPRRAEFFVSYYSNPRDKVPHTPDVCARQAGAIVRELSPITFDVPSLGSGLSPVRGRFVLLEYPTFWTTTIYVFFVEGRFRNSRELVRWDIGMPGNKFVYFSKIDAVAAIPVGGDKEQGIEMCKTLLRESLPILLDEYFPTKEQIARQ